MPPPPSIRRPRVLVADSDDDHRAFYRESLTIAGWDVLEAVDGLGALVQLLTTRTSLLFTELRLPNIDGVSLCEVLRRDPMTCAVPILVLTDETRATELTRATQAGADAVFIKPSTPDLIVNEIRRLLDGTTPHMMVQAHHAA
jgi:two-component system, chemotaxis family, chemotaxis protein CheY